MKFEWDDAKRQANIHKHGIDFVDVEYIFDGPFTYYEDTRFDYGEERFVLTGFIHGLLVVVVFTYRDEQTIRLISARLATKNEQKRFFSRI